MSYQAGDGLLALAPNQRMIQADVCDLTGASNSWLSIHDTI